MKKEVVQNLLKKINIPENQWIIPNDYGLTAIVMTSDGNIVLNSGFRNPDEKKEQILLYFDTINEFLMTKRYTAPVLISSRFNPTVTSVNSGEIRVKNQSLKKIGLAFDGHTIRSPQIGDKIITVNKDTLKQEKVTSIISIEMDDEYTVFILEDKFDLKGKILTWVLPNKYDTANTFHGDESVLYDSKALTTRNFDSLISFQAIGGIELERRNEK